MAKKHNDEDDFCDCKFCREENNEATIMDRLSNIPYRWHEFWFRQMRVDTTISKLGSHDPEPGRDFDIDKDEIAYKLWRVAHDQRALKDVAEQQQTYYQRLFYLVLVAACIGLFAGIKAFLST